MNKITIELEPYTFTGSALVIGLILVNELSPNEQESIGNWLQLVGLVMQTYASQVTTLETNTKSDTSIEDLKTSIDKISEELDKIKDSKNK